MTKTAKFLLLFTIVYNLVEGVIAILSGIAAGSIALVAFGADSYIEVAAATVVYWRLSVSDSEATEKTEKWVGQFVGWTFLALSVAIVFQSGISLYQRDGASESLIGIGLAIASITIMPAVAMWKLRVAANTNIGSLAAEAKETIACSYLSVTLLVGLTANALFGWWWLDAFTALLLLPWLVREGLEGIRGDDDDDEVAQLCSCRACLYGLRSRSTRCSRA